MQTTIILGAPRSGTNMLRDLLTRWPGFGTWPCDEINYIWRHGNTRHPTDELSPDQATPAVQRYVRRAFERLARHRRLEQVVEKTCANSLRVGFVDRILPEARYLFILRDGRDAAASAMRRWSASLDLPYILRKARWVPLTDVPFYGLRYAANRLYRLRSADGRLATWGPRFPGMEEILREQGLAAVCAAQWARCVELASRDLAVVDPRRVLAIRYEDFVADPPRQLRRIADFLAVELPAGSTVEMAAGVTAGNVGKWKRDLTPEQVAQVEAMLGPLLAAHGYA